MLELKIIFILYLQCFAVNLYVLAGNLERFSENSSEETGTDINTTSDNKLTHVRSKNLSGNVELASLGVFTSNILFHSKLNKAKNVNAGSDEIPILEKDNQVGVQTITEHILLSDLRTKGLTDGIEPFSLMDVFNRTSGTLADHNRTEKRIIDTPLHSALIGEEFQLFQRRYEEESEKDFQDIFSGDGEILNGNSKEDSKTTTLPENKLNINTSINSEVQDILLENVNNNEDNEESEISTFIKVDHDFIGNISDSTVAPNEDDTQSLEDFSSIFSNYESVSKNVTFENLTHDKRSSNLEDIFPQTITKNIETTTARLPSTLSPDQDVTLQEGSVTEVPISDEITVVAGFEHFDQRFEFNSDNTSDYVTSALASSSSDILLTETTTASDFIQTANDEFYNDTKVEMLTSVPAAKTAAEPQFIFKSLGENVTINISDGESNVSIPSNALMKRHAARAINITWHSTVPNLNNSLYLNYKHFIQLNIVKNSRMFVYRTLFSSKAENKLDNADTNVIRLGDGIQIYSSDLKYLEQRGGPNYDIESDVPPTPQSLKILTAKIVGSCVVSSISIILLSILVVIRIKKKYQSFKLEQAAQETCNP